MVWKRNKKIEKLYSFVERCYENDAGDSIRITNKTFGIRNLDKKFRISLGERKMTRRIKSIDKFKRRREALRELMNRISST